MSWPGIEPMTFFLWDNGAHHFGPGFPSGSTHHNEPPQHPYHCWRCFNQSFNLLFHFPLSCEKDPELLELLPLGKWLSLNLEWPIPPYRLRTMASDLEVLILIPAASAANCPSVSWRSLFDEANTTTSSANSRNGIEWPLNLTSLGFTYRTEPVTKDSLGEDHPWLGNRFDLLLATWTKLWLWQYRDWMVSNRRPFTPYSWSNPHRTPWGK